MRRGSRRALLLVAAAIAALAAACVPPPPTIDVRTPEPANPARGPAVAIAEVRDARRFTSGVYDASRPSLEGGRADDPALRSRAVARRIGSTGKALNNLLLPEGRTVQLLTREVVVNALRRSGYRVLEPGDPGFAEAAPLDVEILQFWAWYTHEDGAWHGNAEFAARIAVTGPVAPFEAGEEFRGEVRLGSFRETERAWNSAVHGGLVDLNARMRERLRGVAGAGLPAAADDEPR